jgi:hypothetical protein
VTIMFAVLGEDSSDADAVAVLVKRISNSHNQKILKKGFKGCGDLRRKSCRVIQELANRGATRFISCHDADGLDPDKIRQEVRTVLAEKGCRGLDSEIIVPVQEIEAWIVADEQAIAHVIKSLSIRIVGRPESLPSPKEWLLNESSRARSRPLYIPAVHNPQVARFIDLEKLATKCPSFGPLRDFVVRQL